MPNQLAISVEGAYKQGMAVLQAIEHLCRLHGRGLHRGVLSR